MLMFVEGEIDIGDPSGSEFVFVEDVEKMFVGLEEVEEVVEVEDGMSRGCDMATRPNLSLQFVDGFRFQILIAVI